MTSATNRRTSGAPRRSSTRVRSSVRGYEMQACAMSAEKLEEKPRSSWFATVAPSVLLGLLVLELYQQGIRAAMRSLGITIAPLICSLVLLTCALLMAPKRVRRSMGARALAGSTALSSASVLARRMAGPWGCRLFQRRTATRHDVGALHGRFFGVAPRSWLAALTY